MTPRVRSFDDDLGVFGLPGDVSPWDVRFDPGDAKFLERLDESTVRYTVWTEPDLTEAWLIARHPDRTVTGHRMHAWSATGRFTYWSADVHVDEDFDYSFAFRSRDGAPVYRVPAGIATSVERVDRWSLELARIRHVETPDWARGGLIYQIFPDRFANGDPRLDPVGSVPWGSKPGPDHFQGGDLPGIVERLPYLRRLGVDAIYLNPIFVSPSNHRYDTVDYRTVDPALGGDEALRELVVRAHDIGVRVILDASFNHVHPGFFAFRDLVEHGERSPYRDWFVVHDWPVRVIHRPHGHRGYSGGRDRLEVFRRQTGMEIEEVAGSGPRIDPTYDAWFGVPTMPRVDLSNPEARSYMLDVAAYWVREFGVDGWRMDVARYVDADFWDDFRATVKAVDPQSYLVAEIMGDAGLWLQGDRFDATMNYTFRSIALRFFARDEIDGAELLDESARLVAQYPWAVTSVNHNLIGSHDTPRFRTEAGGDAWRLHLATVFQLTFPGAPGIYYGDEIGLEGGGDPACRGAFPWDADPLDHPIAATIAQLTRLRRSRRSLTEGRWVPRSGSGGIVAFDRVRGRERTTIVFNRSGRQARLRLDRPVSVRWGPGRLVEGELRIPGRSATILW